MLNPMSITNRINERLRETGIKPSELARAVGTSKGAITAWMNGGAVNLRPDNLVAAADCLGVEIRWLATGKGPKERRMSDAHLELWELIAVMSPADFGMLLMAARHLAARQHPESDGVQVLPSVPKRVLPPPDR